MLQLKKALLILTLANITFYVYISFFHSQVPFNRKVYLNQSHHYFEDRRIAGGGFEFLRALGSWDAQWYLKIADTGYPENPSNMDMDDKTVMDGLTYAFFPLYPLAVRTVNVFFSDVELSAFVLSQAIYLINIASLMYVVRKSYSGSIAYKTAILFFLYPFGIFFRSYFTEGLFLLLTVWYAFFLIRRNWLKLSLLSGLMLVTRPTGLFLLPLTFAVLVRDIAAKRIRLRAVILLPLIMFGFFSIWLLFNYVNTGDPFYWKDVQNAWVPLVSFIENLRRNYILFASFFRLPFHDIHASRLDILIFVYAGLLLLNSYKFLKKELWLISFLMWLLPVALRDTTSFSRYQSISFPLFIYLAATLNNNWFAATSAVFFSILLFFSLYFVNWYWLG